MSLAGLAHQALKGLMTDNERLAPGGLTQSLREQARLVFDSGGKTAREVFGLDVGLITPVRSRVKKGVEPDARRVVQNHVDGNRRERLLERFLKAIFPREENYQVFREQYLRKPDGKIAIDKRTHESRRVDFVVYKGNHVVRSIEVTSQTENKAPQLRKEANIRRAGGGYVWHPESQKLVKVPSTLQTRVVRMA